MIGPLNEIPDASESAKAAGLRYTNDSEPGITRRRVGKGFAYYEPTGKRIEDPAVIERIEKIVIPPAWTNVWICPSPRGHLLAVGRDDRGRKQYRYHPKYRCFRDETKFHRMIAFAQALPKIRRRIERDLHLRGLPKLKVLAAAVRLLELTLVRVGNQEYARANQSFGLTTLRDRHVEIFGQKVFFRFRGKSKQDVEVELRDRRLARIVQQCQDLPGYELFQYIDEDGNRAAISSDDVNEYLREISGQDFTAKDFRTWAGTISAAQTLVELGAFGSETAARKNVVEAVKRVSKRLGNRPATCRKYYIHPTVLDAYMTGVLAGSVAPRTATQATGRMRKGLTLEEKCVLELIQRQSGVRRRAA